MDNQTADSENTRHPLKDIPIEVIISVGHARPTVKELLEMTESTVLTLDRKVDDPVELFVGERLIARGVLEELEGGEPGQLAVRLTEVATAEAAGQS